MQRHEQPLEPSLDGSRQAIGIAQTVQNIRSRAGLALPLRFKGKRDLSKIAPPKGRWKQ